MTVYLDLVLFLNFCYDFFLILTVDITLKRHTKLKKMIFSALLGTSSIVILFMPLKQIWLFIFKIIASILMVLIAYGYKDIKYTLSNLLYLYMCSIILGGFLYFLNLEFGNLNDGFSINYLVLLIIGPLILGAMIYQNKKIKRIYNYLFNVKIVFKNNYSIWCQGFLDSGNKLKDPITNKYIILVEKKVLKAATKRYLYVPYKALNKTGLLKCLSINYIEINHQRFSNYLVGIAEDKFHIEGVNCLLNNKLMEDIC